MMRWWWFGPAVERSELERELVAMKAAGIGGVEVQPTYPLVLDGEVTGVRNTRFLSPEFLSHLRFAAEKCAELGLRFDLTLGSGWPYGGPNFSLAEAAGKVRFTPVEAGQPEAPPKLQAGEELIASFVELAPGNWSEAGRGGSGSDSAANRRRVHVISSHTRMQVKRPALGAEGYVIDHYSPKVLRRFLEEVAAPALDALGPFVPYAVFCDSLEVAGEDWTGDFLAEFRRRRGYDLRPLLPALFDDQVAGAREIRHDWGRTLTEIFGDNFLEPLATWARQRGSRLRIQGYGTPPATLHSYLKVDLPEGEGAQWKTFRESRAAASASHLLGLPVTSAETWTALHSPSFRATPLDLKHGADLNFLQGVNQLIGHGWPYSPPHAPYPGWYFYAAGAFNDTNPWWIVMPELSLYLQRASYLLRQGQPVNDVALYISNGDAWSSFVPGKVAWHTAAAQTIGPDIIREVNESGYGFDFFDDQLLQARGRVANGRLVFGDTSYAVVILPGVERVPSRTMRLLEEFVSQGGIVIATRRLPDKAGGYSGMEESAQTAEISRRLFQGGGKGTFIPDERELRPRLRALLRPDVQLSPEAPEVGFVHRHMQGGHFYFIVNTGNTPVSGVAHFRLTGLRPEWWDIKTGGRAACTDVAMAKGATSVRLDFAPFESRFLVFRGDALPEGKSTRRVVAERDLTADWEVAFRDQPVRRWPSNRSWTEDAALRHYSGTALYRKQFEISPEMTGLGKFILRFGEGAPHLVSRGRGTKALYTAPVREAAVVYLNGRLAGSLWSPPYELDISSLISAGRNDLRIVVGNLAMNQMAKTAPPDFKALTARFGERFRLQDVEYIEALPSGLLGGVHLAVYTDL